MLETGHKPAQIMATIRVERAKTSAALGAPSAEFVKKLPTYKNIHELECALAGHLVNTYQDWLSGNEWDMKFLGIYTYKFTEKIKNRQKVKHTEPGFLFTSRAIAGNARLLMDAWKDQMAFRVDGTFRLCE